MSRLPRDVDGSDLARLLAQYGYAITRQTGRHMRLTTAIRGKEHHITIPAHKALRVGTLNGILESVAAYLEIPKSQLIDELFD